MKISMKCFSKNDDGVRCNEECQFLYCEEHKPRYFSIICTAITVSILIGGAWIGLTDFFESVNLDKPINYLVSDKKNLNEKTSFKPIFSEARNDTLRILILPFDEIDREAEKVGKAIYRYIINELEIKRELPILTKYIDTLKIPDTPKQAVEITEQHNADLLIYGYADMVNSQCDTQKVCFNYYLDTETELDGKISKNTHSTKNFNSVTSSELMQGRMSFNYKFLAYWISALNSYKRHDYQKASSILEALIEDEKYVDVEVFHTLISSYGYLNAYHKADSVFSFLQENDMIHVNHDSYVGLWQNHRGDFKASIGNLKNAIKQDPNDSDLHFHLALSYYSINNHSATIRILEKMFVKFSDNPHILYWHELIAGSYFGMGNLHKAIEHIEKVYMSDDDSKLLTSALRLVTFYFLKNDHKKTIFYANKALEKVKDEQDYFLCLKNRGISYYALGETQKAMNDLRKAELIAPSDIHIKEQLSRLYSEKPYVKKTLTINGNSYN